MDQAVAGFSPIGTSSHAPRNCMLPSSRLLSQPIVKGSALFWEPRPLLAVSHRIDPYRSISIHIDPSWWWWWWPSAHTYSCDGLKHQPVVHKLSFKHGNGWSVFQNVLSFQQKFGTHLPQHLPCCDPQVSAVQGWLRSNGQPLFDFLAKPDTVKQILKESGVQKWDSPTLASIFVMVLGILGTFPTFPHQLSPGSHIRQVCVWDIWDEISVQSSGCRSHTMTPTPWLTNWWMYFFRHCWQKASVMLLGVHSTKTMREMLQSCVIPATLDK